MENKTINEKIKSLHNINKMAKKIGKRQQAKIRKDTENLLNQIGKKFNSRTYNTYLGEIRTKRIDAVQRLAEQFKLIQSSTEKNITKSKLKQVVKTIQKERKSAVTKIQKTFIKKNTEVFVRPSVLDIYDALQNYSGSVKIMMINPDGSIIKQPIIIDLTNKSGDIWKTILQFLFYTTGTDGPSVFDEYPDAKVYITKSTTITPERVYQAFKHGITNCVFKPIIQFLQEKKDTSQSKNTIKEYNRRLNRAIELEKKYFENGVPEKKIQEICDELQIDIEITQPFQKKFISYRSNKKALRTFRFINTRLNHIDLNEAFNQEPEYITTEELQELYKEYCDKDNFYFTYTRGNDYVSSITTLQKTYRCKKDYTEFINEFENDSGLSYCKLDAITDSNISNYVRQGTHFYGVVDFKPRFEDNDEIEIPIEYEDYHHADMKNAYINYQQCKYYEGFLGKITDFRKTNKIEGLGYYTITNLHLTGKIKELNDKMKIFRNGNVYPSPFLKFLDDNKCKYEIIEGCWGTSLDFSMDSDGWLEKENGVKYYCKYVGTMFNYNLQNSFYMRASPEYIKNMISIIDYDTYNYYENVENGKDEVRVNYKKQNHKHLSHVCGFITGYSILNMMEQLLEIKIEDIIRVNCDAVYFYNHYEMKNCFRIKNECLTDKPSSYTYISNYETENEWVCDAEYKPLYFKELHTGCGGGGKTHKQLVDTGNIKTLYCSPTWKLARNKQKEYNCNVEVWYNILTNDPEIYSKIKRNYNVLIIDEISMLNNTLKAKIFKRYSDMKIIMCGDPGFQLDGFEDEKSKIEYVLFKKEGFDYYEEHNTNHRVQDKKLLFILNKIRKMMESQPVINRRQIKEYVMNNFNKIKKIENYNVKDMILTRSNAVKDKYTELFSEYEKYIIKNNTKKYSNGEIVYEKPKEPDVACKQRHAFTTHSIQGETASNNLYICIDEMHDPKIIYTALSRAKYHDQIHLITS
jgi:hypothetical protein